MDMFWHPRETLAAARATGVRVSTGGIFFDGTGVDGRDQSDRVADAEAFFDEVAGAEDVLPGTFPHGAYTVGPEGLRPPSASPTPAARSSRPTPPRPRPSRRRSPARYGRSVIRHLDALGVLDARTVLAHCVWLDDEEIAILARTGASVAHNPVSNLKLASGVARVPDLLAAGVRVTLGTDGAISGNDLDLWMAMRLAATLHKGTRLRADAVSTSQALRMATLAGAEALGADDRIGSLEPGKLADMILLDLRARTRCRCSIRSPTWSFPPPSRTCAMSSSAAGRWCGTGRSPGSISATRSSRSRRWCRALRRASPGAGDAETPQLTGIPPGSAGGKRSMVYRYYRLPSLTSLAAFEASARHRSIKRAADELNVTPGAVSRQIKGLEEELGVPLFGRSQAGLTLTADAEALYAVLAQAFSRTAETVQVIRSGNRARRVTLACTHAVATHWLMPRMGDFWRRFPEITVDHLISDDARDFRRAEVDLRIRYGFGAWPDETSVPLMTETIYPVAGPEFARQHAGCAAADIPELPLLHVDWVDAEWTGWDEFLRRAGDPARRAPRAALQHLRRGAAGLPGRPGAGARMASPGPPPDRRGPARAVHRSADGGARLLLSQLEREPRAQRRHPDASRLADAAAAERSTKPALSTSGLEFFSSGSRFFLGSDSAAGDGIAPDRKWRLPLPRRTPRDAS